MKKNIISIMLLAALAFVAGGCSGESENEPAVPSYLKPGTDVRPTNWTTPAGENYELWMSLQVQLGDTLVNYQSSADLMCATINDEVRAATGPMKTGDVTYYPLTIGGNGGDQTVSLHYYCDRLHRIYTISNWAQFKEGIAPTGESGIYRPCFTQSYK